MSPGLSIVDAKRVLLAYKLVLPLQLVSTLNQREHWGKRARRNAAQRTAVALCFPRRARGILKRGEWPACVVTLTRIAPRAFDGDNLQGALKGVRDQIAYELGVDDRDPRVAWVYESRKGEVREHLVEVFMERAAPREG